MSHLSFHSLFSDIKVFSYIFTGECCEIGVFIKNRYFPHLPYDKVLHILFTRIQVNKKTPLSDKDIIQDKDCIEYTHYRSDETDIKVQTTILFEDDHLVALYKPPNVPVTPSGRFFYHSMAIWAKEHFNLLELTPLHRIDLETSGVLLFGKTKQARTVYQKQFNLQQIHKKYYAITYNKPLQYEISGKIVQDINSKIYTKYKLLPSDHAETQTYIDSITNLGDFYHLELTPITGKLNQIRIHLASINCSIVGDKKYYPDENIFLSWFASRDYSQILSKLILSRQALHCQQMGFYHILENKDILIQDTTPYWEEVKSYIINL